MTAILVDVGAGGGLADGRGIEQAEDEAMQIAAGIDGLSAYDPTATLVVRLTP